MPNWGFSTHSCSGIRTNIEPGADNWGSSISGAIVLVMFVILLRECK